MKPYELLDAFKNKLVQVDPEITMHFGRGTGNDFTVWSPRELVPLYGGGVAQEIKWRVRIQRFTRHEDDPVAREMTALLSSDAGVSMKYQITPLRDETEELVHHQWDCEVTAVGEI